MKILDHKAEQKDIIMLIKLEDRLRNKCANENCRIGDSRVPYQNLFSTGHNRYDKCNKSCLFYWFGALFAELEELGLTHYRHFEIETLPVVEEE